MDEMAVAVQQIEAVLAAIALHVGGTPIGLVGEAEGFDRRVGQASCECRPTV